MNTEPPSAAPTSDAKISVAIPLQPAASAAVAWALVIGVHAVHFTNQSLCVLIVPFLPMPFWAWAIHSTLRIAFVTRSRGARNLLGIALLFCAVQLNNWAPWEPRSYYWTHRWAFSMIAGAVRAGTIGRSTEYYGEPLPWALSSLSTNGRASVVAMQDDKPVVFLPQWIGIPDDAAGYVFFDGEPKADLIADLFGYAVAVGDGTELGAGWWYVPGGQ